MSRIKAKKNMRQGMVLIISLIFVMVFSSLSFAMLTMSSRNIQIAGNQSKANRALESSISGIEVMKYWMSDVAIPGGTLESDRFNTMRAELTDKILLGAENSVTLDSTAGQSFYAVVIADPDDPNDHFTMRVTGVAKQLSRTVEVRYSFGVRQHSVFDYGVATKGPLLLSGNILLEGENISVDADIYIESLNNDTALTISGNSQIAGEVKISNPDGVADITGGQAGVGTDEDGDQVTGEAESQSHIESGVVPPEFPLPNAGHFEQYVGETTIDSTTTLGDFTSFDNVRIDPNTNPVFAGGTVINGVLFIETPNIVTFAGGCTINGVIVGDGDVTDNSGDNQVIFMGSVDSASVSALPIGTEYDGLRTETGTFLMVPGFTASFGGSFETINGAIAANGINFWGAAGGTIAGSVLNYSDTAMELSGNSDLTFNRSGITEVPAGFEPEIILYYVPASYDEVIL